MLDKIDPQTVGRYPGLGMNRRYHAQNHGEEEVFPIGIHNNYYGANSDILLVREVAMMIVMNQLTEKPNWHIKVFDDTITEEWIQEVVKTDNFINEPLHNRLQAPFVKLKEDQKEDPDWHHQRDGARSCAPISSLYPLIYDRFRVFRDEVVGVEDAIDQWSGKGDVIPKERVDVPLHYDNRYGSDFATIIGGSNIRDEFWSDTYQWLPSNVKFLKDRSVKFTSYINNLHPTKHPDIYRTIEDLCRQNYKFVSGGRTKPRFPRTSKPDDENEADWTPTIESIIPPEIDNGEGEDQKGDPAIERIRGRGGYLNRRNPKVKVREEIRELLQPEAPEFEAWDYGVKPGESLRERFKDI
ncbi:hypothetical protein F53441_11276 [Fusarium austroafricanum]|uniref:DUF4246 domain-containing protein n=1 Tax=Fusarium austroafricanum TaxID=2364996 RepID=A0A8H4K5P3_9HYPO|nr:hypothetical protein F53441_11276 [Fusarium austroafricanum]